MNVSHLCGSVAVELDRETDRTVVELDPMGTVGRYHHGLVRCHQARVFGSIFEAKGERSTVHDEPPPYAGGDAMSGE